MVDVEQHDDEEHDAEQERIKADIEAITDAADKLLARDHDEIYEQERELLQRLYRREMGHDWVASVVTEPALAEKKNLDDMWEYRWTDGRGDGQIQGPYDGAKMKAWQEAGYFEGVEFRRVDGGGDSGWTLLATFV